MTTTDAVLLMAYGTPERLEDVKPYFTHIRGGREPSPDAVANLRARYERVGGGTPLRRITEQVRERLERALHDAGSPRRVYFGMKHWHPYVAESMQEMQRDGMKRVTAVALAPHYSRMSVGAYRHAVEEAQTAMGNPFQLRFVDDWHMEPAFLSMMRGLVTHALGRFAATERDEVFVVFTAHSLPVKIREWNDPYERELMESARAVAEALGLTRWRFGWQSAGGTREPWIGPDILDMLDTLKAEGAKNVLQVPIGFVADHLEVLYDIDIEAKGKAAELGMRLERTELPNARPEFIATLVDVVTGASK